MEAMLEELQLHLLMKVKTDLKQLLVHLNPVLQDGVYVFTSVQDLSIIPCSIPIATFREMEGWSLIIEKSKADELALSYSYLAAWITLKVYSALEAVGLTAAISTALAEQGISCNVVAAFHHDHVFVDWKDKTKALSILQELSSKYAVNTNS